MALLAKYVARHRLRDTRLLDTIADFLVKRAEFLDSKVSRRRRGRWSCGSSADGSCPQVIQKLVFPFSRMSYRPSNRLFFSRLEEVVELKALSSPLATVNILMSLFQLGHFPGLVLHRVFSSAFISNVTSRSGPVGLVGTAGGADGVLLGLLHRQSLRPHRPPLPVPAGRRRGPGGPGLRWTASAGGPQGPDV